MHAMQVRACDEYTVNPHHVLGLLESERPVSSPYLRGYSRIGEDYFVVLVQSEPLFRDLPTEQQAASVTSGKYANTI
jgi:hypothetical protein